MKIKICGITNLADARYAAGAGADYLGFIQFEGSPRYVTPKSAAEIIEWLYGPQTVGVFVNADPDTVNRTADQAGFDLVQLHGTESPEVCAAIERPVIKAIHVTADATEDAVRSALAAYADAASFVLLDSRTDDAWGGTGVTFDWSLAGRSPLPLFLAGGLAPGNVEEAVRAVRPFAVDVSSGVEESPGVKDFEKIDAFIDAARRALPA